jgi:hypothetical protein
LYGGSSCNLGMQTFSKRDVLDIHQITGVLNQ